MKSIRENKLVMGGVAGAIGLVAVLLLVRGLLSDGSSPVAPGEAQSANEELVEEMRRAEQQIQQPEEPPPEPGVGRMVQPPQ